MSRQRIEVLDAPERDVLGEGPWWDTELQRLYWVDILGRKVRTAQLDGSGYEAWDAPEDVGFAVPTADGCLLLGLRSGLALLDLASRDAMTVIPVDADRNDHRINDGKTDRQGRLWFGTMHDAQRDPTSALYRLDDQGVTTMLQGVTTSNGLGWSPANDVMYYTDSVRRQIVAYDFDRATGHIEQPRVFAEDSGDDVPDGLTVDADGRVWAAKWDGGKVVSYAPDGRILTVIDMPVSRPTSCMFVGERSDVLAVTSARSATGDARSEPLEGAVFLLDVGACGLPEERVAVDIREISM